MPSPGPPHAKAEATVVVPMAVQAFVVADDFGDTAYQMAPIVQPDLHKLQRLQQPERYTNQSTIEGGGEWDHLDLMDWVDTSWWRLQALYNQRFRHLAAGGPRESRSGVYLSWCLPSVYRSAITATESAVKTPQDRQAFEERKLRSGYRVTDKDGSPISSQTTQFRAVPDRWMVFRKLRSGGNGEVIGKERWLMVESNCLRAIDDDELLDPNAPDIEITTAAGIDPEDMGPANREEKEPPKPMVMGRQADLDTKNNTTEGNRKHRVPFNAFEMGHEFFVDYQPHNMGVFSLFDDLKDWVNDGGSATVDYAIVGYHADPRDDPLMLDHSLPTDKPPLKNRDIMAALELVLDDRNDDDPGKDAALQFLNAEANKDSRTFTYGVLRNVRFDRDSVQHLDAPSIKLQEDVYSHQPIAVGLDTLDALAAYLHVALKGNTSNHAQNLLSQIVMLVAREDDVDTQRKAADQVANHSWTAHREGTVWHFPEKEQWDEKTPTVTDEHRMALSKLNNIQAQFDACVREEEQLIQRLYGCWWNAMGVRNLPTNVLTSRRERIRGEAMATGNRLLTLSNKQKALKLEIEREKTSLKNILGGDDKRTKLVTTPTSGFGRHQDPVVLLAGAKSGWPADFSKPLPVRLASEIAVGELPCDGHQWIDNRMTNIGEPLKAILREFGEIDDKKRREGNWRKSPYVGIEDMNHTQGWFPLFIEWEIEYYHIPFSNWDFVASDDESGRWRWIIPEDRRLALDLGAAKDCRRIRGRTAFLPQAASMLHARLEQLFSQTTDKEVLARKDEVLNKLSSLDYFSAPLSGLTDHLLTLRRGPNHRPSAASCSNDDIIKSILGTNTDVLSRIEGLAPELAPYGASPTAVCPPGYWLDNNTAFKPVMHGQARFTRLVVVDKFGQIVSGLRPTVYGDNGEGESSALYPCLSPSLTCGSYQLEDNLKGHYWPNTVVKTDNGPNLCQFFQLPPRINENARLNGRYLMPGGEIRRSATEWDNPIWAWLVTNFQNHSIQVYDGEGHFIQEIVLIDDDDAAKRRVVFTMGPKSGGHALTATGRLIELLESLKNEEFAYSLFDMIGGAAEGNWRSSSASLDDMLPAAFGRPFCIADVGISIELAAPALYDASLLSKPPTSAGLASVLDYEFPIAMGNHTAAFDGLVGTFPASGPITTSNISTAYSRWASQQATTPNETYTSSEARPQPLRVKPYFVAGDTGSIDGEDFAKAHDARLSQSCVSAIIDAKLPIHLYSGSLFPMIELSLPRWPVDMALSNMQAFFAVGPTLVPEKPVMEVRIAAEPGGDVTVPKELSIQMPAASDADASWRWMQPRLDGVNPDLDDDDDDDDHLLVANTEWDPALIKPLDKTLKVEDAALSEIVEGYIMVKSKGRAQWLQ
ncbi:hypothetical protein BBK36DRAFT_1127461 [Trichoderma citrinoviride]|uniref:Uncharacterized protein n=1 Tax=Trichoderma citrinoviride TaxID=58853 RepID=A0A2T4B166_9HYPO|nr:hypothetical protein BBK36DRAFT_1127461 [Trichoderma citrinoviride]PTB63054.1 hypothetical protein BBK36DRAFT_1127461 [Trichoderma citrinoviride]